MSSHMSVDDRCVSAFWELKGKREVNTVIYRLTDALDTCVVERQGNLTHDELLSALPAHEPRLVVHDLAFATADGARRNRILLISWLPREITPRHEAATGHAHAALLESLDGSPLPVRATDLAELEYGRLVSQARAGALRRGVPGSMSGSTISMGQTSVLGDGAQSKSSRRSV
ncbi:cofilin family protein [Streptomyces sp. NPDC005046]